MTYDEVIEFSYMVYEQKFYIIELIKSDNLIHSK